MNSIIKSVFIVALPVLALVALADSLWYLFTIKVSAQHISHSLTATCIAFYFLRLFIKPIARTDVVLKTYTFIIFLGCILSLLTSALQEDEIFRPTCTLFNILLTASWIIYLVWYSYFQDRNTTPNDILKVGNMLPLLTFENSKKEIITTEVFAGTPSIFIFYRGNWCPFCMAQIKEMVDTHEELTDRNINTIFVSSQPHGFSRKLTKKYPLDFQFLVDVDGTVAKQLNIFSKNALPFGFQIFGFQSDVILPTVIITDSNEKIIYTNQTDNYRIRTESKLLLKIIDQNA